MKKLFTLGSLISIVLLSCNKNNGITPAKPATGVYIINATTGSSPLIIRQNGVYYPFSKASASQEVSYGASLVFGPPPGTYSYQFVQNNDTLHTLATTTQNFQNGQIYSLFLTGSATQPDQLFTHDQIPRHTSSDSTGGIRFVNLSTGSDPISIDLAGQANGSEVQTLAYKGITAFKNYPATYTIPRYTFEFRDQATGTLLATYTIAGVNNGSGKNTSANTFRYMNYTLAFIGQPAGGTVPQKVIAINNY